MNKTLIALSFLAASAAWAQDDDTLPPEPAPDVDADVDVNPPDVDVDMTTEEEADRADDVDVDVNVQPAQPSVAPMQPTAPTAAAAPERRGLERYGSIFGDEVVSVKAMVGGGDFTEDAVQEITTAGPTYEARALIGTGSPIGIEGAYVGSAKGIAEGAPGIPDDATLVSNGLEGALRIAAPIRASELLDVRPFAFGGLGWQYMSLWGDGPVDGDDDDGDHILAIPAGLGLELGLGALNLDGRVTYRHAVGSDIFGNAGAEFDDPDALHSWNVSGGVGFEF